MANVIALSGGSSGIGAAVIDRLNEKCVLYNLDRVPAGVDGVTDVPCDLSAPEDIDRAVAALPGNVDALIHVAGVAPGELPPATIVQVNFLGLRHLTEAALDRVVGGGAVVIVASSAGRDWATNVDQVNGMLDTPNFEAGQAWLAGHRGEWEDMAYKFSKQCAAAYTYRAVGLARERGVRVNCVNPGIVETPLSPRFREMVGAERYDWIVGQSGRPGKTVEVAEVVDFLATGDCNWLNGVEITVDGGYYAGIVGGWIDAESMPPQRT